jgi:hypothetical protein
MRVGWDLDGVGYVFGMSVRNYLATIGIEVEPPTDKFCKHWNFFEFWKMHEDAFAKHCDDGVDAGIIFGPGYGLTRPNFFESMQRVKALGHTNVIVTHRFQGKPGNAERNTEAWLAPYRHLVDEVYYSKDKTVGNCDVFVEDSRPNYDALTAAGVKAYLINRPWNGVEGGDARNRILDVLDYAEAIEKITADGFADLTVA